jgi:aminoglycoside phosphotransferase (APT) family kinase protein
MNAAMPAFGMRPDVSAEAAQPLWEYVRGLGLRSLVVCASKNPNAKIIVLLISPDSGRPVLAVKAPRTDAAATTVETEARLLRDLPDLGPRLATTIPRVVDIVEFHGRPAMVTTAVDGLPMKTTYLRWRHTAKAARVAADFAAVDAWVTELQQRAAGAIRPLDMDGGVAASIAGRFSTDDGVHRDVERLARIYATLGQHRVPSAPVHGDLWVGNVLLTDGAVTGVVDWESGASSGEPTRDLVRFALTYALFLDRRTRPGRRVPGHPAVRAGDWGAGVAYAFDGDGWFPELFRSFLRRGLERLGASPESWRDAALAGLAEIAATADHPEFARLHLDLFRRLAYGSSRRPLSHD